MMKRCWSVPRNQGPILHLIRLVSKIEPFTRTATIPIVGGMFKCVHILGCLLQGLCYHIQMTK